jgi:phytoene desaturase
LKKAVVIGSGFAGMSAASFMAKAGWEVSVVEKHDMPGGRARKFNQQGFTFDMGPSWYWMPGVFERYFNNFGHKVSDFYELKRLDPSYRVYWEDSVMDVPADYSELRKLFESLETGAAAKLDAFMQEAAYKYEVGINKLVHKPGRSLTEFLDVDLAKGIVKLDVFTSMKKHVGKFFKHPQLRFLMEFPVLFLGALPQNTPALYSLMNYADVKLGTWFPIGGMYAIVDGMYQTAIELGVKFYFNHDVEKINVINGVAKSIRFAGSQHGIMDADVVIGAADYHFIEQKLLEPAYRSYTEDYWNNRTMAPSCLLFYVGINKKLKNILHHTLFFDVDFGLHGHEIYSDVKWPTEPMFYVSATSVTDEHTAPANAENLFFLIPIAAGLNGDSEDVRKKYLQQILKRFEERIGESITENIVYQKSYSVSDFVDDYNAFKGNAYGLANTLLQTAILKPSIKSKKISNLFYTGQLTVPGPGVPPSLISGEVVAKEIVKEFNKN